MRKIDKIILRPRQRFAIALSFSIKLSDQFFFLSYFLDNLTLTIQNTGVTQISIETNQEDNHFLIGMAILLSSANLIFLEL